MLSVFVPAVSFPLCAVVRAGWRLFGALPVLDRGHPAAARSLLCPGWERGGFVVRSCHVLINVPHTAAAPRCWSGSSDAARGSSSPPSSSWGQALLYPRVKSHTFPGSFVSKACAGWFPTALSWFTKPGGFVKGWSRLQQNLQTLVGNGGWRSGETARAFGCYQAQGLAGPGPHLQNLSVTEAVVVVKAVFGNR